MKISRFKVDADRAVRGSWMSLGVQPEDGSGEPRFRVRQFNHRLVAKFNERTRDKPWSDIERNLAFIGSVLITEVENVEDEDGNEVVWSPEVGETFFHGVRHVHRNDDDEDPEEVRPLAWLADAVADYARSHEQYLGDLSGN